MTAPPRAALLARVSREEQKYGYSLDEQIRQGRGHCDGKGYALDESLIFRGDESGKKPIEQRPILRTLIDAVMSRRVDVVVVLETSRLTRDQDIQGYLRYLFKQNGVRIEYVLQDFEDSPIGRVMLGVSAYKDEQEWHDTFRRTYGGLRAKARDGKPIGRARPAFGLRYKPPVCGPDGKPLRGTVNVAYEIDPATLPHLTWMFDEADRGATIRSIARGLVAAGVLPPYHDRTGATLWNVTTVRRILLNRQYVGEGVQFGVKLSTQPDGTRKYARRELWDGEGDDGEKAIPLPPGTFPVVIDPALFERVQARLRKNSEDKRDASCRPDRNPELGLLRRGIARCHHCGNALTVHTTSRHGPQYQCQYDQRKRNGCPSSTIGVEKLDREIWAWVKAIRRDPRNAAELVERLRGGADDGGRAAAMLAAKDEQIAELKRRRENVLSNLERVTGDAADDLLARYQRLGDELATADAARAEFVALADDADRKRQRVEQAVAVWESAPFDLDALSYDEKRRVLKDLGAVVRLYPSDHAPRWLMTFADEADGEKVSGVGYADRDGRPLARIFNPDFRGGGDEPIYDTREAGNVFTLRR